MLKRGNSMAAMIGGVKCGDRSLQGLCLASRAGWRVSSSSAVRDGDAGAGAITALRVYLSLDALVRQIRGA